MGPSSLDPTLPLRAMGDSDASIKRRVADIEAALDNLRADLGDRSDARDAAVAELVAAMLVTLKF